MSNRNGIRLLACTVALAAAAIATNGCGDAEGEPPVRFNVEIAAKQSSLSQGGQWVNNLGWTIQLREAKVRLGPVYFYENPALDTFTSLAPRKNLSERVWDWLVPSAHAHPGDEHFSGGRVVGEWLGVADIDLMSGNAYQTGAVNGLAATTRSYSLWFNEIPGQPADTVALVVGTAEKAGVTVDFKGGLLWSATKGKRALDGLPTDIHLTEEGTTRLEVDLEQWFAEADFASLAAPSPPATMSTIDQSTQVHTSWYLGARSPRAFQFSSAQ